MNITTNRAYREQRVLQILADGSRWTRDDLCREIGDSPSEHSIHAIMEGLRDRGLVAIDKQAIRSRFSRFMYVYRLREVA